MTTHSVATTQPAVNTVLEARCAWCGKRLGQKNGEGQTGITAGICGTCSHRLLRDWDKHVSEKGD